MQAFFQFIADNPYILLFFTVGMAVLVGRFSVKGYGLGMVAAAVVVGAALSTWASTYGVKLQLDNFAKSLFYYLFMYGVGLRVGPAFFNSLKKDGIVHIGGLLAVNDQELAKKCELLLIATEGFRTYGGLSGRDLDMCAQGLMEVTACEWDERVDPGGPFRLRRLPQPLCRHSRVIETPQLDQPGRQVYVRRWRRRAKLCRLLEDRNRFFDPALLGGHHRQIHLCFEICGVMEHVGSRRRLRFRRTPSLLEIAHAKS